MTLHEWMPHRGPMLWLDGVRARSETALTATATVRAGRPLVGPDGWPGLAALELIAQAGAAHRGAMQGAHRGVVVGVPAFTVHQQVLPLGAALEIRIAVPVGAASLTTLTGEVWCDGVLAAEGRVQVMVTEEGQ